MDTNLVVLLVILTISFMISLSLLIKPRTKKKTIVPKAKRELVLSNESLEKTVQKIFLDEKKRKKKRKPPVKKEEIE